MTDVGIASAARVEQIRAIVSVTHLSAIVNAGAAPRHADFVGERLWQGAPLLSRQ
jgi:hypothetical protein